MKLENDGAKPLHYCNECLTRFTKYRYAIKESAESKSSLWIKICDHCARLYAETDQLIGYRVRIHSLHIHGKTGEVYSSRGLEEFSVEEFISNEN